MHCLRGVVLFSICTLVAIQGVLGDTEDKSEEIEADKEIKSLTQNESSSAEVGPPDSHEAMNNRESLGMRNKRSYEFLMGLIHNNSKYEVTRLDPSTKHLRISQTEDPSASEILLELMVKIAAHPDHWNKVHNLLENIDNDLMASKRLVDDLQNSKMKSEATADAISLTKKENAIRKNKTESRFFGNEWPTFQDSSEIGVGGSNKVTFTSSPPESYSLQDDQRRTNYPKTFAYHRVTGRPMFLNKNPKAYIAVSVIAPKPMTSRSKDEDLILEKELRQLKPWTHNQNLKNMASIRSRWIIQRDDNDKEAIAP